MKANVKLILDPKVNHHPDQLCKGYQGSAAHDLYLPQGSSSITTLAPNESRTIALGVRIHINDICTAAVILPRSGTGVKGLVIGNLVGLIDQDYQGELKVSLWNRTNEKLVIDNSKAVAQLMFTPVVQATLTEVTEFEGLTDRGEGGFGSSDGASLKAASKESSELSAPFRSRIDLILSVKETLSKFDDVDWVKEHRHLPHATKGLDSHDLTCDEGRELLAKYICLVSGILNDDLPYPSYRSTSVLHQTDSEIEPVEVSSVTNYGSEEHY